MDASASQMMFKPSNPEIFLEELLAGRCQFFVPGGDDKQFSPWRNLI
jgi:hypothetical protein